MPPLLNTNLIVSHKMESLRLARLAHFQNPSTKMVAPPTIDLSNDKVDPPTIDLSKDKESVESALLGKEVFIGRLNISPAFYIAVFAQLMAFPWYILTHVGNSLTVSLAGVRWPRPGEVPRWGVILDFFPCLLPLRLLIEEFAHPTFRSVWNFIHMKTENRDDISHPSHNDKRTR
jgi:hypothetical protein